MIETVEILKLNPKREVTWRYEGKILEMGEDYIIVEAYFDREDTCIDRMLLGRGDRFVETYFTNRWYNIFEIHAREDDHLRGWYINIASPVEQEGRTISYIDLALDLLVYPDGKQVLLDEDEFAELAIPEAWKEKARETITELRTFPGK